jgi:hypothetical protein
MIMTNITASDRKTLIRLASSLPVGDDTRQAILNTISSLRVSKREPNHKGPGGANSWNGAKNKDYEKHDSGATCYTSENMEGNGTPGKPGCYNRLNEYGKANSGTDGSAARKKYNEKWLKNDGASITRTICPDGAGGSGKCSPSD